MTKLTVKELRAQAKAAGIRGYSRMKKAELEEALRREEATVVEVETEERTKRTPETLEEGIMEFKAAFDKLEKGRVFVDIPELRNELGWTHEAFDNLCFYLRDEGVISLYEGDRDGYAEEDFIHNALGYRQRFVTWN